MKIRRLSTTDADFQQQLQDLVAWEMVSDAAVNATVTEILNDVRRRGDEAVIEYTNRFDKRAVESMQALEIPSSQLQAALQEISPEQLQALQFAAERIRQYHIHQKQSNWSYTEDDGTLLGQQISPMERVGVYVPGGKAAYPSSVIMSAVPAKVAGVSELIVAVPMPGGEQNKLVLAAAAVGGVDRVFTIGGAQAIAALAYGTQTVPQVDKIVGPGNIYVATAKRMVFGQVGIDMIAGPSEILVICDGKTDPDWIAMDLFSQAEHDEDAQSILICEDEKYLDAVMDSINKLLSGMERESILKVSLEKRAAFIKVKDMDDAIDVANYIAPEHLELSVDNPREIAEKIRHAGAIFMGRYTTEVLGDYCAGPNHVLPTSRTARFSSPLGVYDFQKRSSLIMCSEQGAKELGKTASILARGEGLTAHARSAEYRINHLSE